MYTVYLYICIYIHDLAPVASPSPVVVAVVWEGGVGGWFGRVGWEGGVCQGLEV